MRNGNNVDTPNSLACSSSYPTYEEWKHSPFSLPEIKPTVLILPMRNGNNYAIAY